MQGFGVHTFRWVNAEGKSRFVKYHWKPMAGVHSNVFDEGQKIAGKDPDCHRRTLWDSIEMGNYPEYELGVQIIEEEDELECCDLSRDHNTQESLSFDRSLSNFRKMLDS
jgi:catalase